MRRDSSPDFIEAIARGLDVIRCFDSSRPAMTLSEVATASKLPRPTARRILITLEQLGYVRSGGQGFMLTPRVVELGMAYIGSTNIWEIVRPNLVYLVEQTNESSSIAQLDGYDIMYLAKVEVPKLVALSATIGTRFPALSTSMGKVLLAALSPEERDHTLALPSRSGLVSRWQPDRAEIDAVLDEVRERGWAMTDDQLARGIRSIAAPIRDASGHAVAAVNVNAYGAETPIGTMTDHHLPLLLEAAAAIGRDWIAWHSRPVLSVASKRTTSAATE